MRSASERAVRLCRPVCCRCARRCMLAIFVEHRARTHTADDATAICINCHKLLSRPASPKMHCVRRARIEIARLRCTLYAVLVRCVRGLFSVCCIFCVRVLMVWRFIFGFPGKVCVCAHTPGGHTHTHTPEKMRTIIAQSGYMYVCVCTVQYNA